MALCHARMVLLVASLGPRSVALVLFAITLITSVAIYLRHDSLC